MRRFFFAIVATLLIAAIPCSAVAIPDYGTPGEGRVRVLVTGPVQKRGHYWLDAKTGFREFMEHNLAGIRSPDSASLVSLVRRGKTVFIGGGKPTGDPAYGIELQEGDTIAVPYVD